MGLVNKDLSLGQAKVFEQFNQNNCASVKVLVRMIFFTTESTTKVNACMQCTVQCLHVYSVQCN